MWWLGSVPEERQSLGSSSPSSALLGRNLSGLSECQQVGPGLATHIQLLFGGWREAAAMVTTGLIYECVPWKSISI